jgi:hypothetical protein
LLLAEDKLRAVVVGYDGEVQRRMRNAASELEADTQRAIMMSLSETLPAGGRGGEAGSGPGLHLSVSGAGDVNSDVLIRSLVAL